MSDEVSAKISSTVSRRLDSVESEDSIPIVVMLRINDTRDKRTRLDPEVRASRAEQIDDITASRLQEIEETLKRSGGRLTGSIRTLGAVSALASAAAVRALAELGSVAAILLDQPVGPQ